MRPIHALALLCTTLSACGTRDDSAAPGNESARINNQLATQAQDIIRQTDSNVSAIEQALENEGAAVFENREALLNETSESPAATGNRQR